MKKLILPAAVLAALCLFNISAFAQATTYTVTNNTGMVITGVSISPNNANNWGSALNTTGKVELNSTFDFSHVLDKNNCIYDLRYQAEDGTYYYVQDVDLCNSTSITLASPDNKMNDRMNK